MDEYRTDALPTKDDLLRRAAELLKRTEWGTECLCPSCRAPFDGHYDHCEAEKLRAEIRRALA